MRILFIGDIIGRTGRDALKAHLPELKEKLSPDVIIVNVDNAASLRGVTQKIANEILGWGVDFLTGGDHIWNQREMVCGVENISNLLRPANLPEGTPGRGITSKMIGNDKITIIHLGGTVFMSDKFDNPFNFMDDIIESIKITKNQHVFIDFHTEATSEKMAMAQFLDGRVSAVVGSHTHLPTADCQIFDNGTAFQADAGMTGDYNTVIGANKTEAIDHFLRKVPREHFKPTEGEATLCGTLIETDNETGRAKNIAPVRVGGRLQQTLPDF